MNPSIPKTMKAAQLVAYKQKYELKEVPVPEIGDNDLLVKVGAAGFCHTDYQVWEGVYGSPCPIVPSHEPVGTVVAVGSQADGKWKVGQRVGVILFRHQCHTCHPCEATGDIRYCDNKDMAGLTSDGGMAEYIISDAENTVLLPNEISFEQAAPLMCAGATVWAAIAKAKLQTPQSIGVIGIGGLGTLAVQLAKALGHKVVAMDNRAEGRALAQELPLKPDLVVDSSTDQALDEIKSWSGGLGVAAVIVCADSVPVIKWSTKLIRPGGTLVPLGIPTEPWSFDPFDIVFKDLTVEGSLVASKDQIIEMLEVIVRFGVRSHVNTIPLDKVPEVTDLYMNPHLKGRLVMTIPA